MTESVIAATVAMRRASFPEEIVRSKHCDDGFLALLRNDGELHLAALDVEDRVRRVSLGKDDRVLAVLANAAALANLGDKRFRIERRPAFGCHDTPFCTASLPPGRIGARFRLARE